MMRNYRLALASPPASTRTEREFERKERTEGSEIRGETRSRRSPNQRFALDEISSYHLRCARRNALSGCVPWNGDRGTRSGLDGSSLQPSLPCAADGMAGECFPPRDLVTYQPFALKYRPKTFGDVVGQEP